MKLRERLERMSKLQSPEVWCVLALFAVAAMFEHGVIRGSQLIVGYLFVLVLMVFFIRAVLDLASRERKLDRQQCVLLGCGTAYAVVALIVGWPVLFLALIGSAAGFVIGAIVSMTSPYMRRR